MKCKTCNQEVKEPKTVIVEILGKKLEIDYRLDTSITTFSEIKIPKGKRLLTLGEFIELRNNHEKKFDWGEGERDFDEIVSQPIKKIEKKYPFWNVFGRLGDNDRSGLNCDYRDLDYGDIRLRGVRFCRSVGK